MPTKNRIDVVKNYYGEVLKGTQDLKTSACCTDEAMAPKLRSLASDLVEEVVARFYGCGSPIPPALEGKTVLDLGCGTGRDTFLVSKLVGENGNVIGVDMTKEQLDVARNAEAEQMRRWGFAKSNVRFAEGTIENLAALDVADESVDVVISNCVINLSADKEKVFKEVFRVLKPGGEIYFSDVFADRRLDASLEKDDELIGECLGGAMYGQDYRRMVQNLGCLDPRVVTSRVLTLDDKRIEALCAGITFTSETVRAFKIASLEDQCEDFGQVATYLGNLDGGKLFVLDDHHIFEAHRPMLVCGNTAAMLQETRFASYFKVDGDRSRHFGLFDCSTAVSTSSSTDEGASSTSCC
ncbi:MAG: methyltransferase domain-containing protein [Deltaproteobacteria bacterium]|nr:methyltransferase domain-containing protein [Deltaproteobacteria bacterium]